MTQKLKATKDGLAKKRQEHKKEEEILFSGVGTLAGAGSGAFIDTKGQNGGPHKPPRVSHSWAWASIATSSTSTRRTPPAAEREPNDTPTRTGYRRTKEAQT